MAAITISQPSLPFSVSDRCSAQNLHKVPPFESLKLCKTFREIKQIHGQMVVTGAANLLSAVSKLIAAYSTVAATPESLDYAIDAFELLAEEGETNVFLWNTLIRGFSSIGLVEEAIEFYCRMVSLGRVPDRFTFPPLLAACTKVSAFREGEQLHGALIKIGQQGGVEGDTFTENSLIHLYAEHGEMNSAHKVFDEMHKRNVVSWTALIDGYVRSDRPKKAISLFQEMVKESRITPNAVTMACTISACAKMQDLEQGQKLLAYIVDSGMEMNAILLNSVVDMYMKCGAVDTAKRLFDECGERNVVLWNTMISNYANLGMTKEAFAVLKDMLLWGQRPDKITITAGVSASALLKDVMVGKTFHGYILRHQLDTWDVVCNSLIDMYMKNALPDAAYRIFHFAPNKTVASWNTLINGCITNGDLPSAWERFIDMPKRDLVSWNTMIGALVQESHFEEAIELFRELQVSGIKPDKMTMVGIASACGYLGALDLARWTYTYIYKNNIPCDVILSTTLIDMFAKCGDPGSSMQIFANMHTRDISAWTVAIGAMAVEGNGRKALELFYDMLKHGIRPDGMTFSAVLTACSHGGLVEEGRRFFHSIIQDYGFTPEIVHYSCMVDLLGRAGLLEEARSLIETMEVEPNDVIWRTLLAASSLHKDVELAEYASRQVLALSSERSGANVLLSNAYARVGRWQDVAKVRLDLNEKGVQKPTGSSLIDVSGYIHEFTSNDRRHPQMRQIVEMLHEISERIASAGYVPDLGNVLINVNEEEKEILLSEHSEKLAVAYGLISTDAGVPIKIIKNLRTCSDCHSFMKFVSAIYKRQITMRDGNRFHHFDSGVCSCMDYW